jgi:type VI protein secretion system component VasF
MNRVRLALIATADEITQRPGSRVNYAAPPPPGQPPLLQQKHFNGTTIAGHTFFAELSQTIDSRLSSEPEAAVLEAYAVCLAFGFRGKYEAHDIEGYEAMRARLNDKLRLEPIVGPPLAAAVPWPHPAPLRRWPLWIGLSALIFSGAMLLTYRLEFGRHASGLRDFLQQILDRTLT